MLATTASATAAARLHRMLKELGIVSEITGTPTILATGGCGYSVRFSEGEDKQKILRFAAQHGIKIRALWAETSDAEAPYKKVYG